MIKATVTAAWLFAAGTVAAQVDPVEEPARKALAQGDFARVVDLYGPSLAAGRNLPDMSHYRLAISLQKQGDSPSAWKHLRTALASNPQGSFASSAARLGDLRTSILASCEKMGRPGCEEPEPPALASSGNSDPAATATPSAPASAPQGAQETVQPASAPKAVAAAEPATSLDAAAQAGSARPTAWEVAMLLLMGTTLLVAAWIAWRTYRRDRRIPEGLDAVENLRDNVAAFLAGLHASERGRDSALYAPLANLLPLLEREAGRTLYRATGNTKALAAADMRAVEMSKQLSRKPLDVLTASPQEIEAHFRNVPV